MRRFVGSAAVPGVLLGVLLLLWICLGAWICVSAPFASGTDESIRYVAFAAAKNRWATEADFRRYGIDHYYYPPLYFLVFAPFSGDEPSFTDAFDWKGLGDPNYIENGGLSIVSRDARTPIPPELDRLYRTAKFFSLGCGAVILACLVAALALSSPGPARWWLVLGGTAPCLLLPQFLYYQTLCNNDALTNALAALAFLAFIGAGGATAAGRQRRLVALSVVAAACIGLGMLSKQSAGCLIPLLFGLAWLRALSPGERTSGGGIRTYVTFLSLLCAVTVACGGWWTILDAFQGDPISAVAQRLAHPWAFREPVQASSGFALSLVLKLMRSYVALFTGDVFSIPDTVFLLYLAVPLALAAGLAIGLIVSRRRAGARAPELRRGGSVERVLLLTLAATIILNLMLVGLYNLSVRAPYGRLLFPTLVASHLLLARGMVALAGGRLRRIAAASLTLAAYLLVLFLWVFSRRMIPAVTQPAEHLVPIASYNKIREAVLRSPPWEVAVRQQLRLPAGPLRAIRVKVLRSQIPQLGSTLSGSLKLFDTAGRETAAIALEPTPVGDNDATYRWTELRLPTPTVLPAATMTVLDLAASPPWFLRALAGTRYAVVKAGQASGLPPAILNGNLSDVALCLAAVYAAP